MASQKKQGPNQHSLKKWTIKRTAFYYNKEMLRHQEIQEENPKSRKSAPAHLENPERISKTYLGKITFLKASGAQRSTLWISSGTS